MYVDEEVVDKEAIEIYGRSYEDVYLNRDEEGNFAVLFKDPHAFVPSENIAKVSLDDFEILKLVGKGLLKTLILSFCLFISYIFRLISSIS